ncbi:beta-ketoacyl synthase N-terminal-like domain-containing protein [Streptomyces goshikiensis]|uniref:beta-ketoacyl synthase N-terminal-like domain-containing protein n=1 Tax=Streptomyces goshikiensis TaxID=1942 RepID=UPI00369378E4
MTESLDGQRFADIQHAIGCPVKWSGGPGLTRHVGLAALAVREALEAVGLTPGELKETDLVVATAIGALAEVEESFPAASPARAETIGFQSLTHHLRRTLGLRGRELTLSTGCTASIDALGAAVDSVVAGRSQRVLVVGADAPLTPVVIAGFQSARALSGRPVPPRQASCPFSAHRDGFVLGEGAAAVVVESAAAARAAGRRGVIEVCGWGSVSSAHHMTGIRTSGADVAASIRQALSYAALPPDVIDCIDAHGTSTPLNDAAEAAAFLDVFGFRAHRIPVTAQKSVVGHALGAANLLELAGVVEFSRRGVLPPCANTTKDTLAVPLDVVLGAPRPFSPEFVLKTSSGFGGLHGSCILRVLR